MAMPGLDAGKYLVNVSVSDGKYISLQSVEVVVQSVSEHVLSQSVVIKFRHVTPEQFITSYRKKFINIMKNLFNTDIEKVVILGLQPTFSSKRRIRNVGDPDIDMLLAIRSDDDKYVSRQSVQSILTAKLLSISAQLGIKVGDLHPSSFINLSKQVLNCRP